MKKILSVCCAVLLILTAFPASAALGAGEPTITVASVDSCQRGETINVSVELENNPGIAGMELFTSFPSVLTIDWDATADNNGRVLVEFTPPETASAPCQWYTRNGSNSTANGTLITLVFTVNSDAAPGEYDVTFRVKTISDEDGTDIDFTIVAGKITVVLPLTGLTVDPKTATVKTGETTNISAVFAPEGATGDVVWTSSDTSIATVDNGVVTGVKEGEVTITATSGSFSDTCTVTVECSHANTTTHPAVESTCLVQGNDEYVTCNDCGEVISGSADKLPLGDHTGGTATCKDLAVCEVCNQPYGEYGDHDLTEHARNEATHAAAGNILYFTCDICGKIFSDAAGTTEINEADTVIPQIPHSFEDTWSNDETQHWHACECGVKKDTADHMYDNDCDTDCNVCGYTRQITHQYADTWSSDGSQHWHECTVCGDKINVADHTGGTATCKDLAVCEVCNQPYGEYGDHDLTEHARNEATHAAAGNILYFTCDICGKIFSDAAGTTEINEADTVIPQIPHSFEDTWSNDETQHWHACECGVKKDTADHMYDNDCDTDCNVCGYTRQITHQYADTWSSDGSQHWHECTVCGDKTNVADHTGGTATCQDKAVCEVCQASYGNLGEHNYVENATAENLKAEADCVTSAVYYKSCSVCGDKSEDTFSYGETDPEKHKGPTQLVGKVDATCTDGGSTGDTVCTACGETIETGKDTDPNGHTESDWVNDASNHWKTCTVCSEVIEGSTAAHTAGDWIVDRDAQVNVAGSRHKECTVCGYVMETEEIPALIEYHIIQGAGSTWKASLGTGQVFASDAEFEIFDSVLVDGKVVDSANYTSSEGSTVIEFTKDYMSTLSLGTHKLTIKSTDGEASCDFNVASDVPDTGYASRLIYLVPVLFISVAVLAYAVYKEKKRQSV